jgi:hypothetical protein
MVTARHGGTNLSRGNRHRKMSDNSEIKTPTLKEAGENSNSTM